MALHKWKLIWQRAPGSSLDPQNADGPLPFTSAAFLALAYVRLHMDLGPYRRLDTRDPTQIAEALMQAPPPRRGPRLTTALLHSTHALSIPIRMGVDYVARSQVFFWSCQHSLCGLDTSIFLWKWLDVTHKSIATAPLTGQYERFHNDVALAEIPPLLVDENRVVDWLRSLIIETHETVDLIMLGFRDADVHKWTLHQIGVAVLKIWARVLSANSLWPVISKIGMSLDFVAAQFMASRTETSDICW